MPTYEYMARTASGEAVTGVMQAENENSVMLTLDERKLFPVSVAVARGKVAHSHRVTHREVGVLYGQLADLLRAGVPLIRSLDTVVKATPNRRLADLVVEIRDDVSGGRTLAEAITARGDAFASLHAAMIRAGEEAGFLEDVLANLSQFLERQDELRGKVRGAMIYPMLLMGMGVVAITFILMVLVPQFKPMFGNMPQPLLTQVLFVASDLFTVRWPLLVGFVILSVIGVRAILRSESGKRLWERWRLRIPLVGKAGRMVAITRFCRILGTMLANGVPLLQALAISKDATGSLVLSEAVENARENVRGGKPLAEPLRESGLFPPEIVEMIAVAEESNQLEKVLVEIANTVERRTNRQVDQAVRLVEPLILAVLAVMIGLTAVGLLYPIFTMSRMLKQ